MRGAGMNEGPSARDVCVAMWGHMMVRRLAVTHNWDIPGPRGKSQAHQGCIVLSLRNPD